MKTDWDTFAKCKCGNMMLAPFGKLFHVHTEVCPKCGEPKNNMEIVVARKVFLYKWFSVKMKYEFKEDSK